MSAIGTDATDLITTIETDLEAAGNWLETEALGGATALWNVLKVAFILVTSEQAQVIIDVFNKVQSDASAGKSLEQIETDMLQVASAEELVILQQAGSQIIQGIVAFIQASNVASAKLAAKAA
jgi:hypothetical protein